MTPISQDIFIQTEDIYPFCVIRVYDNRESNKHSQQIDWCLKFIN